VRLDSEKAGDAHITLNFDFGDPEGTYLVELVNGVLNHTAGEQASDADATITLARATLDDIALQQTTLDDAIAAGDVTVDGDQAKLTELVSYLDTFEFWFPIVTP
jgi:alkyl sulfatase BDS1-like metallo-beta-lactamase superfamily hydrolase